MTMNSESVFNKAKLEHERGSNLINKSAEARFKIARLSIYRRLA